MKAVNMYIWKSFVKKHQLFKLLSAKKQFQAWRIFSIDGHFQLSQRAQYARQTESKQVSWNPAWRMTCKSLCLDTSKARLCLPVAALGCLLIGFTRTTVNQIPTNEWGKEVRLSQSYSSTVNQTPTTTQPSTGTLSAATSTPRAAEEANGKDLQDADDRATKIVTLTIFDKLYSSIVLRWWQHGVSIGLPNIFVVSLDADSEEVRKNHSIPGMAFACVKGSCDTTAGLRHPSAMWSAKADVVFWMMNKAEFSAVLFLEMDVFMQHNPFTQNCAGLNRGHSF